MILSGQSGVIEMKNYQNDEFHRWEINSTCDQVRIMSSVFETEYNFDFLQINDKNYTGENITIHQIINESFFVVQFTSNDNQTRSGFKLNWECQPTGNTVSAYNVGAN